MPSAFTHYWSESTGFTDGEPFDHTAGKRFVSVGITTGDKVFGVSVRRGVPILIGRMVVSAPPINFDEACARLPYEPWAAPEHLIAQPGSSTQQSSTREIPIEILRKLRFQSLTGNTTLQWVSEARLDRQTFRGVRRLTPESADLLETLLGDDPRSDVTPTAATLDKMPPDGIYTEGAVRQVLAKTYERDPAARKACIAHHGCARIVGGFDFGQFYGALVESFIHVHHVCPLADISEGYEVDPRTDLVPVCPNCHAVIHFTNPPLSISAVRKLLRVTETPDRPARCAAPFDHDRDELPETERVDE